MQYSRRLDDAIALATHDFRHIARKGSGVPYLTHLLAVTALVGEAGGDEDQMIAAVLHDWIEDIPGATEQKLADRFGARVGRLVVALSDCEGKPKPPWRQRKEIYLGQLAEKPEEVKLISAADKLHNARTIVRDQGHIGDDIFNRFSGRKDGTLWYYRGCVEALSTGWDHWLLGDLDGTVRRIHHLADMPWPEDRPLYRGD